MNIRKRFILFGAATLSASCVATVLFGGGLPFFANASNTDHDVVWGHYQAVEAKTGKAGSREYWISCSSHEIKFDVSEVDGRIVDRGAPIEPFGEDDERYIAPLGRIPTFAEGNRIVYGLYPQTHVSDSSLLSKLEALTESEDNGWYICEDEYYTKIAADPYSTVAFRDGETIVSGNTYWFKCEPIAWDIVSSDEGEYRVVSHFLLDVHTYFGSASTRTIEQQTIYPNNYMHSALRA